MANQMSETEPFPVTVNNSDNFTSIKQTLQWLKTNRPQLETSLNNSGAILFRGFPIRCAKTFDQFSAAFGYPNFTYQESLSNAVRVNFTDRVFTANEAPEDVEIYLHHEMAQTPISPDKLFFFCQHAAEYGGETPLCRSDRLYARLQQDNPDLAKRLLEKGVKYSINMPAQDNPESGQGRSWKNTLSVDTINAAEAKLEALGYSWEWGNDNSLKTITPVLAAVKRLDNDKHVFYNQLIAAYMGWQGVRENPSKSIVLGDDSAITTEELKQIVILAQDYTYNLKWQDGDVALIDNKMVMHGRKPFAGNRKRTVLVSLAA